MNNPPPPPPLRLLLPAPLLSFPPPPPPPPPLQTDVDLFGQLSVQVVDQSVEILQAESTVKRSVKIHELVHVQTSSSSSWWPCLLLLLLLLIPAAWNSNNNKKEWEWQEDSSRDQHMLKEEVWKVSATSMQTYSFVCFGVWKLQTNKQSSAVTVSPPWGSNVYYTQETKQYHYYYYILLGKIYIFSNATKHLAWNIFCVSMQVAW